MALPPVSLLAVVLLASSGLHCSSSLPSCLESCTCQRASLLNCSSSGLYSVPQLIHNSVSELDLSHNLLSSITILRPHHHLRSVWLGNNSITHLSLCIERNIVGRFLRRRLETWSREGCLTWAPTLQLLSVERNQLEELPEGLDAVESLQVLQLSFNRISTVRPGELSHLRQLKELDLQHNLITHLHPQMFQDLVQLRVLDLSFNMLTSLHPLMYITLRNIGTDVRLDGNRWQCDCSMRSLRRWMAYDSSRGLQTWTVVCASPSILSDRDLLQLEEEVLECSSTEKIPDLHRDVTVYSGTEILLTCSAEDSVWWTPSGEASVSQHQGGLLISDISEKNTGLYICVSEDNQVVSVFNLQISKTVSAREAKNLPRIRREVTPSDKPNGIIEQRKLRATQSDLALAVCLSVFITFLIAFILGVLARPCIDVLWKRVTTKKTSHSANSVSSVERRQYDNEAFSDAEDPVEMGRCRERRVTFSSVDLREDSDVQYYDTVASGDQGSIKSDAVIECETAGDSGGGNGSRQSSTVSGSGDINVRRNHNMEYEYTPDPSEMKERRSLSSCSDSSLSENGSVKDRMTKKNHGDPKSPQLAKDSLQQRGDVSSKVEVSHVSTKGKSEIPGFSSEPFADWSPHANNKNPTDSSDLQDNEELFEFSDSARSTPAKSRSLSFEKSKEIVKPTSGKQKRDDTSSSSSCISEDEPTQHTKKPPVVPDDSFSSYSSDCDNEPEQNKRKQKTFKEGKENTLSSRRVTTERKTREKVTSMSPRATYSSTSSNDSEEEKDVKAQSPLRDSSSCDESADRAMERLQKHKKTHSTRTPLQEYQQVSPDLSTRWLPIDLEHTTRVKRRLDIKAPSPSSDSSSSSDSEEERRGHRESWRPGRLDTGRLSFEETKTKSYDSDGRWPAVDLQKIPDFKRRLDIKAPSQSSDSSSRSDSEDETRYHSNKGSKEPEGQWPVIDLRQTTRIKRRLDIKAPSPDSSSSSDSEEETRGHRESWRPGRLDTGRLSFEETKTKSYDSDGRWPAVDLQKIPHIKRRLDIKAPSQSSDSSSSCDSEHETTTHVKKTENTDLHISRPPVEVSQTVNREPGNQWPVIDLRQTRIKRRLDIKAPSQSSDSSSSSDSEDETRHHSNKGSQEPEGQWPVIDLRQTTRIKRRLDIKAPSPDSSSSSDSEDETTTHVKKRENVDLHVSRPPVNVSQTVNQEPGNQWPVIDLRQTTRIKRRLDIKAPSPESSSSSDSEDETRRHRESWRPGRLDTGRLPFEETKTKSHDPDGRWPAVDLQKIPDIKRRLDIKAPSQSSDSSSSSDSEDETTTHVKKTENMDFHVSRPPVKDSQTVDQEPGNQWPVIDLRQTRIKRRLDIKAPSQSSDSSSSSDSKDEKGGHIESWRPGRLDTGRLPFEETKTKSYDPDGRWPAVDLQKIPDIKRRLDIKAPSPDSSSSSDSEEETRYHSNKGSQEPEGQWPVIDLRQTTRIKRRLDIKAPSPDSSSSSDSEDETTTHIKKTENTDFHVSRPQVEVSQKVNQEPGNQWPVIDLRQTTRIKRRLDIKAPSPDSSSRSDSEDETRSHIESWRPGRLDTGRLSFEETKTKSYDSDGRWPAVDLQKIPEIKRRLDIKAPSQSSDSSSSSDSEDETITHVKKTENTDLHVSRPPVKDPQIVNQEPGNQWPVIDLRQTTRIKRRLDIKAPSLNSPSSSDSEDETTTHIKKTENTDFHVSRPPVEVSQKVNQEHGNQWPVIDLRQTRIKRRLNIKAPSQSSDSSSSSDSEDETRHHSNKESQEPEGQWPVIDLRQTTRIKRRLDIKAPSLDSPSSSDSEDETTTHVKKTENNDVHVSRPPVNVSQTVNREPGNQWPVIDLRQTRIKRRLDIKAPSLDSPSSSDSEDETTTHVKKTENNDVHVSRPPVNVSQTVNREPGNQWPVIDLRQTRIKRRLDIKAPSPDSSSRSDSEDETRGHIESWRPGRLDTGRLPFEETKTKSYDSDGRWPAVDLQKIPHIKRRLDIKAPSPDSSSSSDSEDETTTHIKKTENTDFHISRPPVKDPQTVNQEPGNQWPVIDLRQTRIKRRLDIKAPSPDSSFSSDSEEETRYHSNKGSQEPEGQWPVIDLRQTTRIKRRLDIKAPSQSSDSPSSSDSEDETRGHIESWRPGRLDTGRLPFEETKSKSYDSDGRWPAVDLQKIPDIKRRLDIKAPSPDSSSSSDSEVETTTHIKKTENTDLYVSRPPVNVSQWPTIDLKHLIHIKRRLDIKAPLGDFNSSVSSDSQDKTAIHMNKTHKHELNMSVPQFKVPQTSPESKNQWPAIDLGYITSINRRLDIKTQLPPTTTTISGGKTDHMQERRIEDENKNSSGQSSSSSDEEEAIKDFQPRTSEVDPSPRWPKVSFSGNFHVKRRLDFKVRLPSPESSPSGGESVGRTEDLPVTKERDRTHVGVIPQIKRRLDVKAPSLEHHPDPSSMSLGSQQSKSRSSTSESEDDSKEHKAKVGMEINAQSPSLGQKFRTNPNAPLINLSRSPKEDTNIKLERYTVITDDVLSKSTDTISTTPEINPDLQTRWAMMKLGISRTRQRLEITSHTKESPSLTLSQSPPDSPYSSSSESGQGRRARLKKRVHEITHTDKTVKNSDDKYSTTVEVKERVKENYSFLENEQKSKPDAMLVDFGTSQTRSYLDVGVSEKTIAPSQQSSRSSSSSSSDNETIDHSVPDLRAGIPRIKRRLNIKPPSPEPSNSPSPSSEDDSLINYKRSIIKASSLSSSSFTTSGSSQTKQTPTVADMLAVARGGGGDRPLTPISGSRVSFDNTIQSRIESRSTNTDVNLPREIRWTGVGRLSDSSFSKKGSVYAMLMSLPQASPARDLSRSVSAAEIMQDSGKSDVTLVHKFSSLGATSVSPLSGGAAEKVSSSPARTYEPSGAVSLDMKEKRGLGAIKNIATERRTWDTDKAASPLFDSHSPQDGNSPLSPVTHLHLPSASVDERRAGGLMYGIPRYRRRDFRPPQDAPPPVPDTPLPDD